MCPLPGSFQGAGEFPRVHFLERDKPMPEQASLSDQERIDSMIEQSPALRHLMSEAMRFAADVAGKPAGCRRRECRRSLYCQLVMEESGEGSCAAGIDPIMVDRAALVLAFLLRLCERNAERSGVANPGAA